MLPLKKLNTPWRKAGSALLITVVVCSLVASVATRYTSPDGSSPCKTTVVQKDGPSESGRQRLTMSTADWLPAVVRYAILQWPIAYRRMSSSEPVVVTRYAGQNLSNRAPPSSDLLS